MVTTRLCYSIYDLVAWLFFGISIGVGIVNLSAGMRIFTVFQFAMLGLGWIMFFISLKKKKEVVE